MKQLLSCALALFSFISISNAQFGLRAGLNLTNIAIEIEDETIELSDKISFHAGVTYKKMINEKFAFRPGILFSAKGWKFEDDDSDDNFNTDFNYFEAPLDFVYNSGKLDIHAGPYLGYLLSATSGDANVKEDVEGLDYGINFGLSYDITEKLGLGINFGFGLANAIKDADEDESAKNRALGLFVTYKI